VSDLSLTRPVDERTLHFGPLGLGGAMPPETSAQILGASMDALVLPDRIPADVRSQFDKLKTLFCDGLFTYESFTFADRDSYRVLEVALKVRFLEHYDRQLPITHEGVVETRAVSSFREVHELLGGRRADRTVILTGHPTFDGSLAALLRWARAEHYLYGQRNRLREGATLSLRNDLQHTEHNVLLMPPDAQRSVHHTLEMICRLWGYDPVPPMTYPGLVKRVPCVVGLGPLEGEAIWCPLDHPQAGVKDAQADERTWYVVLAYDHERLGYWRPSGVELTTTPVNRLWGPGSWDELRAVADHSAPSWATDAVEILDRLFYIRVRGDQIELPRSAESVRSLRDRDPSERWLVVRSDGPGDATSHARDALARTHPRQGPCHKCPAESMGPIGATRHHRPLHPGCGANTTAATPHLE
jgi:hypothetical protein